MLTVIQIVINMYGQTTVTSRFAYIFWSMLILIYVYTAEYERLHNLSLAKVRTKTKFNYPFFLYIFGAMSIAVHHLTLFYGTAWRLPFAKILGFLGWFVMAGGFSLVLGKSQHKRVLGSQHLRLRGAQRACRQRHLQEDPPPYV